MSAGAWSAAGRGFLGHDRRRQLQDGLKSGSSLASARSRRRGCHRATPPRPLRPAGRPTGGPGRGGHVPVRAGACVALARLVSAAISGRPPSPVPAAAAPARPRRSAGAWIRSEAGRRPPTAGAGVGGAAAARRHERWSRARLPCPGRSAEQAYARPRSSPAARTVKVSARTPRADPLPGQRGRRRSGG